MIDELPTECPECGNVDLDEHREEIEYGKPTNTNTRGAVAPNYKTRPALIIGCPECEWYTERFIDQR